MHAQELPAEAIVVEAPVTVANDGAEGKRKRTYVEWTREEDETVVRLVQEVVAPSGST